MGKLPLYGQSFGFSCGPAALMMVLKDLDPEMVLGLASELDIWRDATLVESKATSAFGLALAARRRGFDVSVMTDSDRIGFTSRLKRHFPRINVEFMEMLFEQTRDRAVEEGVNWIRKRVEAADIEMEIDRGRYPIVLISSKMMRELVGIPHWVVVTGYDNKEFHINNPETSREESYSRKRFEKYLGFTGYRCMILVSGK